MLDRLPHAIWEWIVNVYDHEFIVKNEYQSKLQQEHNGTYRWSGRLYKCLAACRINLSSKTNNAINAPFDSDAKNAEKAKRRVVLGLQEQ